MKTKKKLKKLKFKVPIYECQVRFVICKDFIKTGRVFKEELALDINDHIGLTFKLHNDSRTYVIMIKPKWSKSWDTISHEALHAVNFILDDRGIKCTLKNDEAQAYLLSYITGRIQKFIDKL